MIFFLVNPKIWIALGVLFVLALARRSWRSWRARRRAARLRDAGEGARTASAPVQTRRTA